MEGKIFEINNIEWDIDSNDLSLIDSLPKSIEIFDEFGMFDTIEDECYEDLICEYLTNRYGILVRNFSYFVTSE